MWQGEGFSNTVVFNPWETGKRGPAHPDFDDDGYKVHACQHLPPRHTLPSTIPHHAPLLSLHRLITLHYTPPHTFHPTKPHHTPHHTASHTAPYCTILHHTPPYHVRMHM